MTNDSAARTWAMALHLSVFAGVIVPGAGLVAPIAIWLIKKNDYPELDVHGKIVVNFMISMLIYSLVAGVLCLVLIGIPLLIALGFAAVALPIIGAIKASSGEAWPYPLMLNLIR